MKIRNRKFMRACESKWRKMDSRALPSSSPPCPSTTNCNELIFCPWLRSLWQCLRNLNTIINNNNNTPKDVPKGHMAIYVGQDLKRYVIKITLLKHPLFGALLDQARDEYGFTTTSKLCIPCNENMFLDAIRCASSPRERRIQLCL